MELKSKNWFISPSEIPLAKVLTNSSFTDTECLKDICVFFSLMFDQEKLFWNICCNIANLCEEEIINDLLCFSVSFGFQLSQLEEFFQEDDIFFVYGSERINADDFELDFEGEPILESLLAIYILL